jgi:ABC-type transport system substrate-binding protein
LALALVAAGCSSGNPGESGNSTYVPTFQIGEPQHLLPTNVNESEGNQVLSALFAPLVDFDEKAKPFEVAAESVTSTDSKVWTVKLKAGWTFHNGEPVNADSYINAWNYGRTGRTARTTATSSRWSTASPTSTRPTPTAAARRPRPSRRSRR